MYQSINQSIKSNKQTSINSKQPNGSRQAKKKKEVHSTNETEKLKRTAATSKSTNKQVSEQAKQAYKQANKQ